MVIWFFFTLLIRRCQLLQEVEVLLDSLGHPAALQASMENGHLVR
jgi:hypothetical protein